MTTEAQRLTEKLRDMTSKYRTPSHERGVLNGAIQELRRLETEVARLEPLQYRQEPCHKFCEANAFKIEIRGLEAERDALKHTISQLKNANAFGEGLLTVQLTTDLDTAHEAIRRLEASNKALVEALREADKALRWVETSQASRAWDVVRAALAQHGGQDA